MSMMATEARVNITFCIRSERPRQMSTSMWRPARVPSGIASSAAHTKAVCASSGAQAVDWLVT